MRHVEVIDLLSSSPLPVLRPPVKTVQKSSCSTASLAGKLAGTAAPGNQQQDSNEWFILSDDEGPSFEQPLQQPKGVSLHEIQQKAGGGRAIIAHDKTLKDISSNSRRNGSHERVTACVGDSARTGTVGAQVEALEARKATGREVLAILDENSEDDDIRAVMAASLSEHRNKGLSAAKQLETASVYPPAKKRRLSPVAETTSLPKLPSTSGKSWSRTISDTTAISRSGPKFTGVQSLQRSKTSILEDDPIQFTSSPDYISIEMRRNQRARKKRDLEWDDSNGEDDDLGDMPKTSRRPKPATMADFSSDGLPDIHAIASQVSTFAASRKDSQKVFTKYQTEKAAEEKALERTRKAKEKAEAKEADKEQKRIAREGKVRDRQIAADLAKINTLRDKKVSTPEMIIYFPEELDIKLSTQARSFLTPVGVECKEWSSPIPRVIKWHRKIEAKYNDEIGHWEPTPHHIADEMHVMCHMLAKEFVDLVSAEEGQDLDAHVLKMKTKFDGYAIIFLIEGLNAWMRKNRNILNRKFVSAVREQMNDEGLAVAPSSQRPKKKKEQEHIDEDMVEDALLKLQVRHGTMIHHTSALVESAQWILALTQHISTIPYRRQKMALDTAFCMDSGQVKTGTDAADTFVRMLQEVNRITTPLAWGIASEYPTVQKLHDAFNLHGRDVLQNVRKSANKDGAATDREVGKRVSRRLHAIFTGTDEGSTDV